MNGPSEVPDWLERALRNRKVADDEFREQEPIDLLPGDVVVVGPYDDASAYGRLLVVVDVDKGYFTGMMAITETDLATAVDAVLAPEVTGLRYPIVVLTRFLGPLWTVQVRQRVGALTIPILEELEALSWNDEPPNVTLPSGQPLQPEGVDPHYPFRQALSLEFDILTEHYRRRCHDLTPILDPVIAEADVLALILTEPHWEEHIHPASASHRFQEKLLASLPSMSKDQRLAARPFIEKSLHRPETTTVNSCVEDRIAFHRDSPALATTVIEQQDILPSTLVVTHTRCWTGSIPEVSHLEREGTRTLVHYDAIHHFSEK